MRRFLAVAPMLLISASVLAQPNTDQATTTTAVHTRHRKVVKKRSGAKSAAIVAGSAAGGAVVGGLAGGGKGAAIGAAVGGGSGLAYDRATHKKTVKE